MKHLCKICQKTLPDQYLASSESIKVCVFCRSLSYLPEVDNAKKHLRKKLKTPPNFSIEDTKKYFRLIYANLASWRSKALKIFVIFLISSSVLFYYISSSLSDVNSNIDQGFFETIAIIVFLLLILSFYKVVFTNRRHIVTLKDKLNINVDKGPFRNVKRNLYSVLSIESRGKSKKLYASEVINIYSQTYKDMFLAARYKVIAMLQNNHTLSIVDRLPKAEHALFLEQILKEKLEIADQEFTTQ